MPLLVSTDLDRPYNQSAEVSVAARDGIIVVASIQLHFTSASSFHLSDQTEFRKRVAINVSTDHGQSFDAAIDPGLGDGTATGDQTSDPVIRVSKDGMFFLMVGRAADDGTGYSPLARSTDGRGWTVISTSTILDRQWFALDDPRRQIYVGARGGYWRYSFDGQLAAELVSGEAVGYLMTDAFVTSDGVRFASLGTPATNVQTVLDWDGNTSAHVIETLDGGTDPELYTTVAWSSGPLADGMWSVRALRNGAAGSIVLRVERDTADPYETVLTQPGACAFLPVAALDERGRLHVVWYDTGGGVGVLRYTHSFGSAPFSDGFVDPLVIDDNAAPGDGWYPEFDTDNGGRRLREYIGLAVDHELVYVAWTHAPVAPSRVHVAVVHP